MDGSCHCGAVRIFVPSAPTEVTECHCSICRRYGGLWAYYPVPQVTITGPTVAYSWGRKHIAYHRCEVCGCVMAWRAFHESYPESGVNARMLDGFDLADVTHIIENDASV